LRLELIEQQYVTPARVRLSLATREYSKAGVALARLEQLGERLSRDEYASTELQNFWQDLAAVEQVTAPGSKSSLYHGFRRSQLSPELLAALGDP
jgi:cystathionine beta-lyase/cystathionine gamma-synthase